MLLLAPLAQAADLTVDVAYDTHHQVVTFADAQVGALPSLVLPDPAGEIRVDLTLGAFDLDRVALTYKLTRAGKKPTVLESGQIEGGGANIPLAFGDGPARWQITAYAAPIGGVVDAGPLAGCQWQRQLGKTDVVCQDVVLQHVRVDKVDTTEMEAGVTRARSNPALASITANRVPLALGDTTTQAYEVVVTPVVGSAHVSVFAWLGAAGLDQVRCEAQDEATCGHYLGLFVTGLPAALR
jgi:hypothetical protein